MPLIRKLEIITTPPLFQLLANRAKAVSTQQWWPFNRAAQYRRAETDKNDDGHEPQAVQRNRFNFPLPSIT
jgi:hypothetical protein